MSPSPPVPLQQGAGGEGLWVSGPGLAVRALRLGGVAGLLLTLAFPPIPLPLLAFLAFAPLALLLERLPPGPAGSRAALLAGASCGVVSWSLLLHWVPGALLPVAPLLAFPLFVLVVGALAALAAAVARAALGLRRKGVPVVLALPLLWVAGEWLRSTPPGVGLAWLPLGTALVSLPPLSALAEWVGVYGLSLWAAAVGSATGVVLARDPDGFDPLPGGRPLGPGRWGIPLVLFLLPAAAGFLRDRSLTTLPFLEVAALQFSSPGAPGVPPEADQVFRVLSPLLSQAPTSAQGVDLLLLPEGTIPSGVGVVPRPAGGLVPGRDEGAGSLLASLEETASRSGIPLLVGGYAVSGGTGDAANAALLVHPSGAMAAVHLKRHLVPGIEGEVPGVGRLMELLGLAPRQGGWLAPGRTPGTFLVGEKRLGVLI